jgi:hypothetical protein
MVTITRKDLEIGLKKRGWEQYRDFAVSELKKGRNIREVLKHIAGMDAEDFIKNLQNPKKLYLPESYKQGELEIALGGKEKMEGYLEVKGKVKITPKCHEDQSPYQRGNILACTDDSEETIE